MKFGRSARAARTVVCAVAVALWLGIGAAKAAEITIWSWDPFNTIALNAAVARYTAKHPDVTFNLQSLAKSDVETKLQTSLASGFTDALPDITLIEDYEAQKYLQTFPDAFVPSADTVDLTKFAKYKVDSVSANGKGIGVPFDSGVAVFFYRRDYLEQAGYKPDDLKDLTWDKFIEIGKAIKAKTGHSIIANDPLSNGLITMMMQSAGGWYFDKDGKPYIDGNAPLRAAVEEYSVLLKSGIMKAATGPDLLGSINSGDVAGTINGIWMIPQIEQAADQSGKWGIAPFPKLTSIPGAVGASNNGGSSWYVLSTSPNKTTAMDFLNETFGKDTDFYQDILLKPGAVGTFLPARTGAAYSAPDAFFGGQKIWQDVSAWLPEVPSVNFGLFTPEMNAALADALPDLVKGASVDSVLAELKVQAATRVQIVD